MDKVYDPTLPIICARSSYRGKDIHINKFVGNNVLVSYNNEQRWIQVLYERVKDGTYNQPVKTVPYIVIENDVYPLDSFKMLGGR